MPTPVNITPNMNLPNPVPGLDQGPDWANNIQQSLNLIDAHDHTPGKGVPITPAAININANLPFSGFSATGTASIQFSAQSSLASLLSLYTIGNDLYFNDGASNVVRITSGGTVNATSSGISSGSATAAFVSSVLVVNQAANTPANIQVGSVLIGNNTVGSDFITLAPPTLSTNYTLTLPSIPAGLSFLQLDTSGNITAGPLLANGITAAMIANATITTTQISAIAAILGSQLSASAGIVGTQLAVNTVTPDRCSTYASSYSATGSNVSFSSNSTSMAQILIATLTNFNIDRPTLVSLSGSLTLTASTAGTYTLNYRVGRLAGGVFFTGYVGSYTTAYTTSQAITIPLSMFSGFFDNAAGAVNVQVSVSSTNLTASSTTAVLNVVQV